MRPPNREKYTFSLLAVLIIISGCTRVGPDMMHVDRFDYTTAVADSWNEQVLLNIVRLRYNAWPVFVGVEQIVTGYTMEHSGSARFIGRRGIADIATNDQLEAGWVGKFSERPTVLYKPLSGKKYVNSLLTPAKAESILSLMESGWPIDHLGRMAIRSVNEFYNTNTEYGIMHRTNVNFARFLTMLQKMQSVDAVKIHIARPKDQPEVVYLTFIPERLSDELQSELQELKADLKLDPDKNSYIVVRDSLDEDPGKIRIEGRSILQVLVALATGVEIPAEHLDSGKAPPLEPIPEDEMTDFRPLMTIRSSGEKPQEAFVSVRYKNIWFWIDETDHFSKRSLLYALALITLLDTDEKAGGSVVIPVN